MSHNYNNFTKKELASFLQKHENNFRLIDSPYNHILDQKIDAVIKKIDENLERSKALSKEYESTKDGFKYIIEIKKNNEKWMQLNKEYDRLEKMRFSKEAEK